MDDRARMHTCTHMYTKSVTLETNNNLHNKNAQTNETCNLIADLVSRSFLHHSIYVCGMCTSTQEAAHKSAHKSVRKGKRKNDKHTDTRTH